MQPKERRWNSVGRLARTGLIGALVVASAMPSSHAAARTDKRLATNRHLLPLSFESNQGQTDAQVKFLARGQGYTLFLTDTAEVFELQAPPTQAEHTTAASAPMASRATVVRVQFVGAAAHPQVVGQDELPGKSHYFLSNDPTRWHPNVPTYAKVVYTDVYPGIDLVYYSTHGQLEHDVIVHPGADPAQIRLAFDGMGAPSLDKHGNLLLTTPEGQLCFHKPQVYQKTARGAIRSIRGSYVLDETQHVQFKLARYDATRPLIIDPVLTYSTYLGGSGYDSASGVAVDAQGFMYLVGATQSVNFPATSGHLNGITDIFVTKLSPDGSSLVYSTYLGGLNDDSGLAIALNSAGEAHITGYTNSKDFPVVNPFQGGIGGGLNTFDAFVTILSSDGASLSYSTYLGGTNPEYGRSIALDATGQIYVCGQTTSPDFPVLNAWDPVCGTGNICQGGTEDAFVAKFAAKGASLLYSTFLGGETRDDALAIAVDGAGSVYVTGETNSVDFPVQNAVQPTYGGGPFDAFLTVFNSTGTLVRSTYVGGSAYDSGQALTVSTDGYAYLAGWTSSSNFPTTSGAYDTKCGSDGTCDNLIPDAFVTKVDPSGHIVYSTFLGGKDWDQAHGIALYPDGSVFVTGETKSTDFPVVNPIQATIGGGGGVFDDDVFVTNLSPDGSKVRFSTYLGGSSFDIGKSVTAGRGVVYVAGQTSSTNFPTTTPYQSQSAGKEDAFLAKIQLRTKKK